MSNAHYLRFPPGIAKLLPKTHEAKFQLETLQEEFNKKLQENQELKQKKSNVVKQRIKEKAANRVLIKQADLHTAHTPITSHTTPQQSNTPQKGQQQQQQQPQGQRKTSLIGSKSPRKETSNQPAANSTNPPVAQPAASAAVAEFNSRLLDDLYEIFRDDHDRVLQRNNDLKSYYETEMASIVKSQADLLKQQREIALLHANMRKLNVVPKRTLDAGAVSDIASTIVEANIACSHPMNLHGYLHIYEDRLVFEGLASVGAAIANSNAADAEAIAEKTKASNTVMLKDVDFVIKTKFCGADTAIDIVFKSGTTASTTASPTTNSLLRAGRMTLFDFEQRDATFRKIYSLLVATNTTAV